MSMLSTKRSILCSRSNAHCVAARLFDTGLERVSVVRTGDLLQPFRVIPGTVDAGTVELEMRTA